jgi:hypothetical protein
MIPEYLSLFSNSGPVKVAVRFSSKRDKHRSIRAHFMYWHELDQLINPATGEFHRYIRMDEHECLVKKYEIDPRANSLTIVIEETDLPSPQRMAR